jgi:hypothetical protein
MEQPEDRRSWLFEFQDVPDSAPQQHNGSAREQAREEEVTHKPEREPMLILD